MNGQKQTAADLLALATSKYQIRGTRLAVLPDDEPLHSEQCTNVSIVDEAAWRDEGGQMSANKQSVVALNAVIKPESAKLGNK